MEQAPPPGLLWVDAYTDRCPLSGGTISVMEVDLTVQGLGISPITLGLGWSDLAACHVALLEDLFEMSDEAGLPPWAATGFQIDGRAVAGAVYLTEPDVVVPWSAFAERMEAAAQRAERPPPTAEEVGRLPRFDETWELAAREVDVVESDGEFVPLHLVVVVDAPVAVRVARAAARDGVPEAAILARVRHQADPAVARAHADRVVDNTGDLAALHAEADALARDLGLPPIG